MNIRPFKAGDMDQVIAIANRAWRGIHESYKAVYGEELYHQLFPTPETRVGNNVKERLEKRPDKAIVVEDDGKILGFLTYWLEPESRLGVIGYNAADPDCLGKGIGQQMYRFALDIFRREGMRFAKVHTGLDDGHAPARRAYERAGFNIHRDERDYYMKL